MLNEKMKHHLKALAKQAPEQAGVYLMYNKKKTVLYVGKAKNLKKRLLYYFRPQSNKYDKKTEILVHNVEDIHHIVTRSEYEALLLEHKLIKQYHPRYNIELKDGKSYPVIRITQEVFPRVFRTRRIIHDGSTYYGPFPNVQMLDKYLSLIQTLYPLRRCRKMKKRNSPCLYYHIQQCAGTCAGKISSQAYLHRIQSIRELLAGNCEDIVQSLKQKMKLAAQALAFEKSAQYRDAIQLIIEIQSQQNMLRFNERIHDYIGYVREQDILVFTVLHIQAEHIVGSSVYALRNPLENIGEQLSAFLMQHYQSLHTIPQKIFIQHHVEQENDIIRFLQKNADLCPRIITPQSKQEATFMNIAIENAWFELYSNHARITAKEKLISLQKLLKLPHIPLRIDGFDVAHIAGNHTVASMVYFRKGKADTQKYMRYHIKTLKRGKINDYAAIYEVIIRHYTRIKNTKRPLPDLILIDGGKGQVNRALQALNVLCLSIPLVGLAKKNEELFLPLHANSIRLPKNHPGLHILQHIRNEAHRFATNFRASLQQKELQFSFLNTISGIGPKRATHIMQSYETLSQILTVPINIFSKTIGLPKEVAQRVQQHISQLLDSE